MLETTPPSPPFAPAFAPWAARFLRFRRRRRLLLVPAWASEPPPPASPPALDSTPVLASPPPLASRPPLGSRPRFHGSLPLLSRLPLASRVPLASPPPLGSRLPLLSRVATASLLTGAVDDLPESRPPAPPSSDPRTSELSVPPPPASCFAAGFFLWYFARGGAGATASNRFCSSLMLLLSSSLRESGNCLEPRRPGRLVRPGQQPALERAGATGEEEGVTVLKFHSARVRYFGRTHQQPPWAVSIQSCTRLNWHRCDGISRSRRRLVSEPGTEHLLPTLCIRRTEQLFAARVRLWPRLWLRFLSQHGKSPCALVLT